MEHFEKHEDTLKHAIAAIGSRKYWSAYPDSPRAYSDEEPAAGEEAFQAQLGRPFELDQPQSGMTGGGEYSPYGVELGVTYPKSSVDQLMSAARTATATWGKASPQERAGVCLEILDRLRQNSFEMAHAVMQTTGQPFLMAFQTGGPHALDRGLEAIAYAYAEMTKLPAGETRWEKPQGKRDPLQIDKKWLIRPRGVAVALCSSTSPTLDGYPGIFASLVTGNPVIVKPHPGTILPLAIFVDTARTAIAEAGFDPNTVLLAVDTPEDPITEELVMHPAVGIIDYTGSSDGGDRLERDVTSALVFIEKSGVNSIVLDSAPDLKGIFRNLSVSLTMYSGQMRTAPQNVYIPAAGIEVDGEQVPFGDIARGLVGAIESLLSDDQRAGDVLGAIKGSDVADLIADAAASGQVLLESRRVNHPTFPAAEVRTPLIVKVDADYQRAYMRPMSGPVIYLVATADTEESLDLARKSAIEQGAVTWLVYTTNEEVKDQAVDAAVEAGVSVAFNLAGGLYVNESAAFSDFNGTGANPSGNATVTDPAFVAGRFRVIGVRSSA